MAVSFKKKIRSNTKSIIAKNGSAFFVHKKEVSYCPEEILQTMELLQAFQVQIDCIDYGILDYARLKQYLMHTWEKQEQFEQDLDAYLCSCCTREGI